MLLPLVVCLLFSIRFSSQDQSIASISGQGWEFIPAYNSYPPIFTCTAKKLLNCQLECNKRIDCRTFDFDDDSRQCRLWDCDGTTGSIFASPSKPRSSVGTIRISASTYVNTHNQSCNKCVQSRYETCDANSSTCQCPSKTFWNGLICLTQLLQDQICSQDGVCRSDLNLTCQPSCDQTYRCLVTPMVGVGQTVAGYCNGTTGGSSTALVGPWGIYVSQSDGTLYVVDTDSPKIQAYPLFSRTGLTLPFAGLVYPYDVFVDSSNTIYVADFGAAGGTVYIQRNGINLRSIPATGQSTTSCYLTGLYMAYSAVADRSGNIYVSVPYCAIVVKWAPNATTGVLFAGQLNDITLSSSTLNWPRFIHLDEDRGALYVTDSRNQRVQRFMIGGSGIGVTVAGGHGSGTALNQLNDPSSSWVTRDGQTLYVADYGNHRIMKWTTGATTGSFVAGSVNGIPGNTNQLLNGPSNVALDPSETYLYIADYANHRVQRFRLQ